MRYNFSEHDLHRKDNGKRLYFTKCDCPASFADKNILLVHGLTYTQHVFDLNYKDYSVVRFLAKNGYTVWRVDIGGYGPSEEYEDGFDVTTENAAKDIITALEEICRLQGVKKVDLLGWSWGCMTTAKVGEYRPDLVNKLVWIGTPFGGTIPATEVKEPFTYLSYPYVIRVFQHMPGSDYDLDYLTVEPEVAGIWCDHVFNIDGRHGRPNGANREIMACGDGWLIDTSKVKVPTCILNGDIDFYIDQNRVKQAFPALPEGSELHTFHGAGHALYCEVDYYKPFRETLLKFLQK